MAQDLIGFDYSSAKLLKRASGSWAEFTPLLPVVNTANTGPLWCLGEDIIMSGTNGSSVEVAYHFHGGTWTEHALPDGACLITDFVGTSYSSVYACGSNASAEAALFFWNGTAWSQLFSVPSSFVQFSSVSMTDSNNVWCCTASSYSLVYQWNGSSAVAHESSIPYDVHSALPQTIYTRGASETYLISSYSYPGDSFGSMIYKWNGSTWAQWALYNSIYNGNWTLGAGHVIEIDSICYYGTADASGKPTIFSFDPSSPGLAPLYLDAAYPNTVDARCRPCIGTSGKANIPFYVGAAPDYGTIIDGDGWSTLSNSAYSWLGIGLFGTPPLEPGGRVDPQNYEPGDWVISDEMSNPTGRVSPQNYEPGDWATALPPTSLLGTADPQNYAPESTLLPDALTGTADPSPELVDEFLGWRGLVIDIDAPYLQNQDPAPSQSSVSPSTDVVLEVMDLVTGVDAASVIISVGGSVAWSGDAQQAGFTVVKLALTDVITGATGFRYTIDPDTDFSSSETVAVHVFAQDAYTNTLDTTYSFYVADTVGPVISAQSPTGVDVVKNSPVYFEVDDGAGGSGIDSTTLQVVVGGSNAIVNGAFQAGWSGTITADGTGGFDVTINKSTDFTSYSLVVVDIDVEDLAGNPGTDNWSFRIEDYQGPTVIPVVPSSGQTSVATNASISFEVTDTGSGVDPTSVLIIVDAVVAYSSETNQNGFTVVRTAITDGYAYVVTAPAYWSYGAVVRPSVYALNMGLTPTTYNWAFTIIEDSTCFTGPLNATETELTAPFTSLPFCEKLRTYLLSYVTTNSDVIEGARSIFLRAHSQELAPVLFGIVPPPTVKEAAVRLCHKATNLAVDNALRRKSNPIPGAIQELVALGLPDLHRKMFESYAREDQPNTQIPLICVMVLLAKALE